MPILTAYMSISPLEPVLVFASPEEAASFQSHRKQGRILFKEPQSHVYLPMPQGLLKVRTARDGDVAFDFDSDKHAKEFNASIRNLGRILLSPVGQHSWEKTVYVGKPK